MTQTTDAELVGRLRDEARDLQKAAWGRSDGGQDCSISAMLADEAADTIEAQARRIEALEAALAPFSAPPLYVFDGLPSDRFVPAKQPEDWIGGGWFTAGEFDTARALLTKDLTP